MYCRCTRLLFYSAFASMWVSTCTLLTIGMVHCHGCLGNTCYSSVFLLKIHRYRIMPVPRHVRVFYSQQIGFWASLSVGSCLFLVHALLLLSQIKLCNYLWFSHCVLHFVTGLNERDTSVPIIKIIGMLNYNSCCWFDCVLYFYHPVITHYEFETISEHFVLYLYHLLKLYCTFTVWQFSVSCNALGLNSEITYHCPATVQ
jgi:hypothetical protein